MKSHKAYFSLTLLISILLGILLPLALGVKDPTLIATTFTFVWFLYGMILFIYVFLIRPGFKIKVLHRKNPTIVKYELRDPKGSQDCSHDSVRVSESASLIKDQKEYDSSILN